MSMQNGFERERGKIKLPTCCTGEVVRATLTIRPPTL